MIRILIVDDHPLIRVGLRATFEQEPKILVVGEAGSGLETQQLCEDLLPDLVLLNISTPIQITEETIRFVKERFPQIKIIILTAFDNEAYVRNLVNLGIDGYVLKDEAPDTLVRATRTVMEGDCWYSRRVIDILASPNSLGSDENGPCLTERESEVLSLLVSGKSNGQIAEALVVAEGTVKNHLVNIYQKMGVHSRSEAIAWALNQEINK
jgi:DNA-binding NarL/FixJ family response regulator